MNAQTINKIKDLLEKHGIQPSYQRIKIMEFLYKNKNHPTIEEIYNNLSPEIPTLSRTTVYNTIHLFNQKGLVSVICIDEKEMHVDPDVKPHIHFKCIKCGRIYDIKEPAEVFSWDSIDGHIIYEKEIFLKGICKHCKNESI